MNVEGLIKVGLNLAYETAKLPVGVASNIRDYTGGIVTDTRELFSPTLTSHEFVEKLKQDKPIADAHCAINALKTAKRLRREAAYAAHPSTGKDVAPAVEQHRSADILNNIGFAMLKKAIIRAETNEKISDTTTQQLVFVALEAGADPSIKGYLEHEEASEVAKVFDKHDNIAVFSPRI